MLGELHVDNPDNLKNSPATPTTSSFPEAIAFFPEESFFLHRV
jgi:hypothetical protein